MPFGRRHAGRGQTAPPRPVEESGMVAPHHPSLPDLPANQSELFFECTLFLYSVLALFLQYLNLYKTLWWLPNSYTHYAVKFHLIDPYLLSCVGLVLGRRVTWSFLSKISLSTLGLEGGERRYVRAIEWSLRAPLVAAVLASFVFSLVRILSAYPLSQLLYLGYPLLAYCLLFYNEALWSAAPPKLVDASVARHACVSSASHIREEADLLVVDLAYRCKTAFFSAFSVAYFAVFVPVCFAPATLYVDAWWVSELFGVVFMTSLSLLLTFLLPLHYCDLLHRAAWHLGAWDKMDGGGSASVPPVAASTWCESSIWPDGAVVKHGRTFYRAEGMTIAAEPGNVEHARFYHLSSQPVRLLNTLCLLEFVLIVVQFLMLVHSTDWQHIVTLVLLMFANYLLLFKLFKDKVILGRIYFPSPEDEELLR